MGLKTLIDCDRCGVETTTGVLYDVDRVIIGERGSTLNINQLHLDREQWWRQQMGRMSDLVEAAGVNK